MARNVYTQDQLKRYLEHIQFPGDHDSVLRDASNDPLGLLTKLQIHHMSHVPFESLSLHYSRCRLLSLDPEDLFVKIVEKGRGGYCMEVNRFFATVLRTLGYTLISAGGRVRGQAGYNGWDHMVNLVTIGQKRYLVDVGFGSNDPPYPVPLEHDYEFVGVAPFRGRLQYRSLDEHSDPSQRVWVYSGQDDESSPWRDLYAFVELEFLPGDFEVMNLKTMTTPQSFFVQSVMCMCTVLNSEKTRPVGLLILHRDYVKKRMGDKSEIIETLGSEDQRVHALEKYFGIVLAPDERKAIQGLASELRPRAKRDHA